MFPSCYSKPADSGSKRSSIAKLLLGVFVVYMLHTAWLLYGFLNTKSCDGGRGEHCITSYLAARPRLQVRACLIPDGKSLRSRSIGLIIYTRITVKKICPCAAQQEALIAKLYYLHGS